MAATRTDRASAQRKSLRERVGALRNLPPFLRQVWETSPALTLASLSLRLVRALLPVVTLYVGKLIIDEAIRLAGLGITSDALVDWWRQGLLAHLGWLLAIEFGLAVASDVLGRIVALVWTRCCPSASPTRPACA